MTERISKLDPAELDEAQRGLYDAIAGGRRANGPFRLVDDRGRLEGPFNAFLLQPAVGSALQALGAAVRYDTGLSDRGRETAILVVARRWDSAFEWYAHEAVARAIGLDDAALTAIWDGRYDDLPEPERSVARTTAALVSAGDLDDTGYDEAVALLGERGLFELLTLVGYYATLALQLRVFRVPPPADA